MEYNIAGRADEAVVAAGVQDYMTKVYGWMTAGLGVTAGVSYLVLTSPAVLEVIFANSFVFMLLFIGQLLLVGAVSGWAQRMETGVAAAIFLLYSALNGITFSAVFLAYAADSIINVFVTSALAFAALSLFGLTTKRDLSGWGSFLFIGLIGVMLAFVVEMFLGTGALGFAATVIGVIVFAGLTAYDSNRIKEQYLEIAGTDAAFMTGRFAVRGALTLYLDFVNLFLLLLRLFGDRR